jgi:ribosome-binding factor A
MKQPSQRQLRVSELVRHAVSDALVRGELRDPALDGLVISVPEVRMSPDLKVADVFVMPLGGTRQETVLQALSANRRRMRGLLAKRVQLKYTPEIRFHLDTRFDEAGRIDALLRSPDVRRDLDTPRSEPDGE